ncbi:MAG: choice-of-anchor D domain-containing protein [Candidatus Kapaibacterium sp.]|nr:MAG: choice-of-anchor D domain-containing protein [Candidatus Kapabacteria bacterium]
MKRVNLLLCILVASWIVPQWATAQQSSALRPWVQQNPLPQSNPDSLYDYRGTLLRSVRFASPQLGCAVGEKGNIVVTRDGGVTWQPKQSGLLGEFYDVFFLNTQRGWALIDRGRGGLATTRDGGNTWTTISQNAIGDNLFFLDEQNGWIATGGNAVSVTKDGGATWMRQELPTNNAISDVVFLTPQLGWACGSDGIFRTNNGGTTWTQQLESDNSLYQIQFVSQQRGWARGAEGQIFATNNGGILWTQQRLSTQEPILDVEYIQFFNDNTGIAADENFVFWRTSNGGTSWTKISELVSEGFLQDVFFLNENQGWAITTGISQEDDLYGYFSIIWQTSDGGRTWRQLRSDNVSGIYGLAVNDAQNLIFSGDYVMGGSSNGGANWDVGYVQPDTAIAPRTAQLYYYLSSPRKGLAYTCGDYSRVGKTEDGGKTWQALSLTEPRRSDSLLGIHFINEQTGWIVGLKHGFGSDAGPNVIYKTTNAGRTWTLQTPRTGVVGTPDVALNGVFFINDQIGWVVGEGGVILKTTNGGSIWTAQRSTTRITLHAVHFVNPLQGFAVGGTFESAMILATSDGGTTWRRQLAPSDDILYSVFALNPQVCYAVGQGGTILATKNGGATWENQESGTTDDLLTIGFASPVQAFIGGVYGKILTTKNGGFTPQIRTNTESLDFGRISVNEVVARTLTVSAEYLLEALTITAPTGTVLEYGSQRNQQQIQLQPNALTGTQATITVRLQTNRDGNFTSLLQLSTAFASSTVALVGFGINRPVLAFEPQSLNFGGVNVGTIGRDTLRITNTGVAKGTVSAQLVQQDTTRFGGFRVLANITTSQELQAQASVRLPITFIPRTIGEIEGQLQLRVREGAFDTIYAVRLVGTGLQAILRASTQLLEFGSSSVGQETRATLGITNAGNLPVTIQRIRIEPEGAFFLRSEAIPAQGQRVNVGESVALNIGFVPQTLGFARAALVIETSVGNERIALVGSGVPLLAAPVPISPFNGRINTPVTTVLQWRNVLEALGYELQISRDSSFRSIDFEQRNLRSSAFSPTGDLLNNTTYYWRVKSRSLTASSEWSSVWSFETVRSSQRIRNSPEPVQVSGFVGQTQRGVFTIRSVSARTAISRAFWQAGSDAAFSLRQDQFPLDLRTNVTEFITFDFKPTRLSNDIRGILVLVSPLDTHRVQIIGEGIEPDSTAIFTKVAVRTDRSNATAGDTLKISVVLTESRNLDTLRNRNKAQTFNALLKIRNETVLAAAPTLTFPQDLSNNVFLGNGGKTIELRDIPRTSGMKTGVLAEIPAIALLGNATSTVVEFLNFQWNDGTENRILQSVVDSSVAFVSCSAGGTRLIKIGNANSLTAVAPNPASHHVSVKFTLLETAQTEMYLVNVLGQRVRTYFDGAKSSGEYAETLDVTGLPDGIYTLILQTPREQLQQRIGVLK